jgi:hypothetical protein
MVRARFADPGKFLDVQDALAASPVELTAAALLRIARQPNETAMLAAIDAEVCAAIAPKPPTRVERLLERVAELEAEKAELKAEIARLRAAPMRPTPARSTLTELADKQQAAALLRGETLSRLNRPDTGAKRP